MTSYLLAKYIHIVCATVLLGTGAGIAFFMWRAFKTGDAKLIAGVARIVVLADWLFTLPAVITQLLTGLYLAHVRGLSLVDGWIGATLLIYMLIGACWLPVLWLQIRIHSRAACAARHAQPLDNTCLTYFRIWFALGWPAFIGVLVILWMMINQRLPFSAA